MKFGIGRKLSLGFPKPIPRFNLPLPTRAPKALPQRVGIVALRVCAGSGGGEGSGSGEGDRGGEEGGDESGVWKRGHSGSEQVHRNREGK